jgi:glycosyltransferase involved in cell wall biosynthesis
MSVGDGSALHDLRRLAADRGPKELVVFTGSVPSTAVREYYAAIDVFCVPRADVPVTRLVPPLKPIEAMATGRPVVASDLAPLREIIEPGHTGVLVPPGDPWSLADALEPLVTDEQLRGRLGRAARAWVAQNRTWDAVTTTYLDVYARLTAR